MKVIRRALCATLGVAITLAIAGSAQAAVVTDSFTGTDGTLLQNHVGEVGASWTKHPNYPANLTLLGGRVWGPQWALYFPSGTPTSAEYDVSADLTVQSNTGATGVVARATTSGSDNFYVARYNAAGANGPSWELVKCVSTCTVLAWSAQTLAIGSTYHLLFQVRNATKKLFVDGVERASSTDNAITQIGKPGIRQGPGDASSTTGYHVDNFSVDPPPSVDTTITAGPSGATNNASPSFSFSSTPSGGTFECKLDGPGTAVGTWAACTSPKAYSALAEGSYTFNVRATVGGVTDSTPATRSFTVDTTAPPTSITSGPSGPTNSTAPSFGFSSTDATATFECKLDGPGTTVGTWAACTSPKAYSALAEGSYTFNVRAVDPAGNVGTAVTRAFTVDTTAPNTTIDSSSGTTTANPTFTFSSEAGATFECKLDGPGTTTGTYAACTSPKSYSGLADGSYTFSVRAKDAAGNVDATPATQSFTVATGSGTILWQADAEQTQDLEWASLCAYPFTGGVSTVGNTSPRLTRDSTIVAKGLFSWHTQVQNNDNCSGERAEFGQGNPTRAGFSDSRLFNEGDDRWISWQIYLPNSFDAATDNWHVILQWKQLGALGTPVLSMEARANQFRLYKSDSNGNTNNSILLGSWPVVKNRWVKFTIHIKFSPDPTVGFVELYGDPSGTMATLLGKTFTYTMKVLNGVTQQSHSRIGIYRNPTVFSTTEDAYYDGYTVATSRAAAEAGAF